MATTSVALEVSDADLFRDANSDEAPADTVVAETPDAPEEQAGQPRDEAGRFAGKPETAPETPAATDPPARAPVDDNAAMVPSWRVREINDEKRTLAEKLAALEAERQTWQRQQPVREEKQPEKVAKPDPLLDPEGYAKAVREELREEILSDRREDSMRNARDANPKEFGEAYAAATQNGVDLGLKARMQAARDPGKVLLEWHREQKTRAEVGTDPNAYFDKRLATFLADPANQAKVLEQIRGGVQPATNGKSPPVSLPPSLTRATSAAAIASADDDDVSDAGLWRHANASA